MQLLLPFVAQEKSPLPELWEQFAEEDRKAVTQALGRLLVKVVKMERDQAKKEDSDARE